MTYTLRILKLLAGQPVETQRSLLRLAQLVDTKPEQAKTPPQPQKPSAPTKTYTVQSGDTLSGIAAREFGQADAWPQIYSENKQVIGDNPNLIEPGMVLKLPTTLRALTPQEKSVWQQSRTVSGPSGPRSSGGSGPTMGLPFDPRGSSAEQVEQFARKMGFVHLKEIGIPYKNHPWVTPELAQMLKGLNEKFPIGSVTEAWPASSRHQDPNHFNARGVDFIMKNWNDHAAAAAYCSKFGFDVLDEYVANTRYKTGAHIHVDMGNRPSVTDKAKYLAWEELKGKKELV